MERIVIHSEWSDLDVRDSLEYLIYALVLRQTAFIVLIDVFSFTSTETATSLGQPASAIKVALHRARSRLKKRQQLAQNHR